METRDKGLNRSFKIDRSKLDVEKRTIEVAFSSEEPVERWGENEVLSHEKGDYDFSRLNADHPLLLGHDEYNPKDQIGVIESARVDGDKVGRAVVRFGNSTLAKEIFEDVKDGIRKLISVGYDRTGIISSKKDGNNMTTTRYRWCPSHIAIVPVPADTTVGVGREKVDSTEGETTKNKENFMAEEKTTTIVQIDEAKVRSDALKADANRRKEIRTAGDLLAKDRPDMTDRIREMVNEACEGETTVMEFNNSAMREVIRTKAPQNFSMAQLGVSKKDQKEYSLLRAIQSCINKGKQIPEGFEGEVHQEISKRNLGVAYEGFLIPADLPVTNTRSRRDLQVNVFSQGGATVAQEMTTPIIELLRNRMVTTALGVRSMAGLEGNIVIPRQTGAATAYAVSEIQALTISTQALDQIALTPKRIGAYNQYSKQLLLQSSIDVENFIRDDLMKVVAIKWDLMILNGQGAASEPLGIMNTPGIGSVTFGAAATFAKLVSFWTNIATANADVGEMAYVTTPTAAGTLQSAAKLLTGATTVAANPLWEGGGTDGRVNNYRAMATNQMPNNQILFGVWSECIHALWGGYDVVVNPYSLDTQAEVRITVNTWGDVAVRHPQCFCVSSDSAAQ